MKFASALTLLLFVSQLHAQPARSEEVRQVTAVTLYLQANSLGQQFKRVTYTPPPGWYVRSHEVVCTLRRGPSSYAVSTVPAEWSSSAEERSLNATRVAAEGATSTTTVPVGARVNYEALRAHNQARADSTSHHALVVEATTKGAGLFQGGGALELVVVAELVRVNSP